MQPEKLYIENLLKHFEYPNDTSGYVFSLKENAKNLDFEKLKSFANEQGYIFDCLENVETGIKFSNKDKKLHYVLYKAS